MHPSSARTSGLIAAFGATLGVSSYIVFGKFLTGSITPLTLAALIQAVAAASLLLIFGAMPELKKLHQLPTRELAALVAIGLLASAGQPLLFMLGVSQTTATNAAFIAPLEYMLAGFIAAIWLREAVSRAQIGGAALMLTGLFIIVAGKTGSLTGLQIGDALILAGAAAGAIGINLFKKYLSHRAPEMVVMTRSLIGALFLLFAAPFVLQTAHQFAAAFAPQNITKLIAFAIICTVLAQMLWYHALQKLPASSASSIKLTSPLFTVLLAILFLNETLAWQQVAGGALILGGLVLTMRHHQAHPQHAAHQKLNS